MKKWILPLFVLALFAFAPSASADEVVGHIYSTNIVAYVNGQEITSYSIEGKTAIAVEDLADYVNYEYNYGFEWRYDDTTRTVTVESTGDAGKGDFKTERGTTGRIVGDIYATDIKVIFNGSVVPSYSIGGRTAICIEDVGTVTEDSKNKAYGYSDYLCHFRWYENERDVKLYTYQKADEIQKYPDYQLAFQLTDNQLTCQFDFLNPYECSFSHTLTDSWNVPAYTLFPVYMDGEQVGIMYLNKENWWFPQYDISKLLPKTAPLVKSLTYEEALAYVKENFEILDTAENALATTYIAQKENHRYLLHALKPRQDCATLKEGGLVAGMTLSDHYTEVSLGASTLQDGTVEEYVNVYPFGGPHGTTAAQLVYEPGFYDFKLRD